MSVSCFVVQEPEPIDWESYRKGIGSRLVDMYKQAYESMFHCSFTNVTLVSLGYLIHFKLLLLPCAA
jgi:hypothetical protein